MSHCNHSGCYCKSFIVPTSKWSDGKCKNCNHAEKEHTELSADVSYESSKIADAPVSNTAFNAQIDSKMGIVPSGKTNYKDAGGGHGASSNAPSIYSITLNESDWINWSAADLLVWFRQKKKLPDDLSLKSIEHEMQTKNISGEKMTQLSQSTMLSHGFTDYNHRSKLMEHIKNLLEQYPPGTQTLKIKPNAPKNVGSAVGGPKAEQKEEQKTSAADEAQLMQAAKLNEAQWKTWSTDQVWTWICIKQGWADKESMDYLQVHKLNEFEAKLASADVNLNGGKLKEVQQDIKTQTLLKAIGFTFSQRKQIYKEIDALVKKHP